MNEKKKTTNQTDIYIYVWIVSLWNWKANKKIHVSIVWFNRRFDSDTFEFNKLLLVLLC